MAATKKAGRKEEHVKLRGPWGTALKKMLKKNDPPRKKKRRSK